MGKFLENNVLGKLKFSKNVNNKKCTPKMIFFNEKKIGKIQIILDIKKLTLKLRKLQNTEDQK